MRSTDNPAAPPNPALLNGRELAIAGWGQPSGRIRWLCNTGYRRLCDRALATTFVALGPKRRGQTCRLIW